MKEIKKGLGKEVRRVSASILILLIPVLILIGIIFVITGIIGVKKGLEESGEKMIKNVYIYLVLFATLMMTIGGSVSVFMAVADIIAPTPYYQSYDDYVRIHKERPALAEREEREGYTEEELRERYDRMVQNEMDRQMSRAKNTLIKSFGWIVIPLPVFLYFQRRLSTRKGQTS